MTQFVYEIDEQKNQKCLCIFFSQNPSTTIPASPKNGENIGFVSFVLFARTTSMNANMFVAGKLVFVERSFNEQTTESNMMKIWLDKNASDFHAPLKPVNCCVIIILLGISRRRNDVVVATVQMKKRNSRSISTVSTATETTNNAPNASLRSNIIIQVVFVCQFSISCCECASGASQIVYSFIIIIKVKSSRRPMSQWET